MRASLAAGCALLAAACAAALPAFDADEAALSASYPEGPLFHGGKLYFAEMGADRITVLEDGAPRPFTRQPGCGPTAIAPYGEGFLVLCHVGARVVAVDSEGRPLRAWRADRDGHALRDPNDASADGRGGVYFTDPGVFARETEPHGYLMHLSPAGELRRVAGPYWYPNGVYVDQAARAAYVSEHMTGRILRFDLVEDGGVVFRGVFADVNALGLRPRYDAPYAETGPDGLEIGPDGDLYVALYGGGRILRFGPDGAFRGMVETRPRYVTNIAFDGAGRAVVVGPFENLRAPYPGEVRFLDAARLTAGAD